MSANTLTDMDIKPNAVTYGVFTTSESVKDKDGNETTRNYLKATMNEKQLAKAESEGTLLFKQSFSYDIPATIKGIQEIQIPDEEKVNIFRQGLVAKVNRGIVAALEEQEKEGANVDGPVFQPTEGNFDARAFASEESGRRGLTDTEKAFKMLKNLPKEVQELLLAQLAAQQPAS